MSRRSLPVFYDCSRCPAYCCSYPQIAVADADLRRLAARFGLTLAAARRKFTKKGDQAGERVLRHRRDAVFGSVCRFLDPETRECRVYEDRPHACRVYPGTVRCGYYDFLSFERRAQEDPEFVAVSYNP
jgi:hypothetical protein